VHSSWTPIHLPSLYPHSYYNSRYGLAVVVLMAFAAGALVMTIPDRLRPLGFLVPLITVMPWILGRGPGHWICWKESEQNSISRRAWTAKGADYLTEHYRRGDGLLTEFGDLAGILCRAGLPLKEAIHEGSGPAWFANTMPNGLVRQTKWAIAQEGDKLSKRLAKSGSFQVVNIISVKGAPKLLIYERRYSEMRVD
jgi:hypothetical protein